MAKKRITELTEATSVKSDHYIPVDHGTDGTQKMSMSTLIDSTLSTSGKAADAKATGDSITELDARMDTFTSLPSGSTSGDAELMDIRVGADGTTYQSAGSAVRGQISEIKEDLGNLSNLETEDKSSIVNAINEVMTDGGGMTGEISTALLNCFGHVAWADADGQTYYNQLRTALGYVPVSGITLSSVAGNIYTGYTGTVTATIAPSNATDKSITWTSSDTSVATVSVNGTTATISGVSDGSAIITATTNDGGFMATYTVTVATAVPTGITLSNMNISGLMGTNATLTATVTPAEASNKTLTWSSSDTSKVTVTPSADTLSCTVNFIAVGSATITATSNVGSASATCSATTTDAVLTPITPTVKVRASNSKFEYAYVADTKETLDTSDTSQIKDQMVLGNGALVFDCTGVSRVRVKRYIRKLAYGKSAVSVYAFNHNPSYDWNYVSDKTTSPTTDAGYLLIDSFSASAYGGYSVGDLVTVDDYVIDQNYPYIVCVAPYDTTSNAPIAVGASTDVANFTIDTGVYTTKSANEGIQIASIS